jgi:hypothetical protein
MGMNTTVFIGLAGALITIYLAKFHTVANYSNDQWDQKFMDYVTDFRKSYST